MEATRETVKIEDKLNQLSIKNEGKDQEKCGGKEEKIRQLLQELIESEMRYVEDLNEICRDYIQSQPDQKNIFRSLDRKHLKTLKKRAQSFQVDSTEVQEFQEIQGVAARRFTDNLDLAPPSPAEMRQIFGNIEDLKDYHSGVILPRLQGAISNEELIKELFLSEQPRLTRKYGRYCINYSNSINLIQFYIKYFSVYQFKNGLKLRIDGMLIKPIQRLTKYHMFLQSLSDCCADLDRASASLAYSLALERVLGAAEHTNTMMWVGAMEDCPHNLTSLGQLLKHGKVETQERKNSFRRERLWYLKPKKRSSKYLFLFQQSIILCRAEQRDRGVTSSSGPGGGGRPHLTFSCSLSVNQVRIRDVVEQDENMFEIHRLENIHVVSGDSGSGSRSEEDSVSKLRILCPSVEDKNSWVSTINLEIRQLQSLAKTLSQSKSKLFKSLR